MSIDKFGRHLSRKESNQQQEIEEMKQFFQNLIRLALTFGSQYLPSNLDLTDKQQWKLMTSSDLLDKISSNNEFKHWYQNNV